jgi:arylsulfatase A-like enzyme
MPRLTAGHQGRPEWLLGALLQAARDAGVYDETTFVVVGDHGFFPVHTEINAAALLIEAGHARLTSKGELELTGMETGFVAAGPGVRAGLRLPLVRQVDVAPTLARILGVEIAADGRPIAGLLAPGVGAGTVGQPAGSRSK